MRTLCKACTLAKLIVSATGSQFLMCTLAKTDERFTKYPPQPVLRCSGYRAEDSEQT